MLAYGSGVTVEALADEPPNFGGGFLLGFFCLEEDADELNDLLLLLLAFNEDAVEAESFCEEEFKEPFFVRKEVLPPVPPPEVLATSRLHFFHVANIDCQCEALRIGSLPRFVVQESEPDHP